MVTEIDIGGRPIGNGHACFIIAEAGVNHNGDMEMARRLVDVAVESDADAVKFQTFKADRLVTECAPKADYQLETTDAGESHYQMLRRLELSSGAHDELVHYCHRRKIVFLSTPFDEESADALETLGVPAFKISSGEITNLPFLEHVARKAKPMIISTGMSTLEEVEAAVKVVFKAGNRNLVLLHCVTDYPADPRDANLRAMDTMAEAFGVPVGFSDHTPGIEVALAAVARGACVLEKHFTLDCSLPGPDHRASLEPDDLARLVKGIRTVEAALGHGRKEPAESEAKIAAAARKSIVAARDIPAGTPLTAELLSFKRPGTGLPPSRLRELVGRVTAKAIAADTVLTLEMLR